eukprot:TRINITY_DN2331_c0_g1_i1.p2 TRINITY_DN2331_c0_g1~~TRINITY_DN2331_c0_g1_i1.p2  ORF type:complete len:150 (-),score=17.88 TRINITY_DN2331_c0_g1_i1:189-638(-)
MIESINLLDSQKSRLRDEFNFVGFNQTRREEKMCRGYGCMSTEFDLINWSEPSKTESRTRIRVLRLSDSRTDPTQKGGLRDVELSGDRLHPPLVSLFLQQTHRSRVSLKGRVSERVDHRVLDWFFSSFSTMFLGLVFVWFGGNEEYMER